MDPGGAHRHLFLIGHGSREHRAQAAGGPYVQHLGQVDQTAPAMRVLQCQRPAQGGGRGLADVSGPFRTAQDRRSLRQRPEPGVDTRVLQRLGQGEGQRRTTGQVGVFGMGALLPGQQGQHAGDRLLPGGLREQSGHVFAGRARIGDDAREEVGSGLAESAQGGRRVVALGTQGEPATGEAVRRRDRQGCPGNVVAPGSRPPFTAPGGAPGRQGGQDFVQGFTVDPESFGELGGVL